MAKEPMEEELEIVPTPSKEAKIKDMNRPVTIMIVINDRPDLEYTITERYPSDDPNKIVYEMTKEDIAAWKQHKGDLPCPRRIILPKVKKVRVVPDIVRERKPVPEDELMKRLEMSFEKMDREEYIDPIFVPSSAETLDMTLDSLYDVVYKETSRGGRPIKSVIPKKGQTVPRVIVQPENLEVVVNIPVLETNVDELDAINLNTTNSNRLRLKIYSVRNHVEFVAEDRDKAYFKKSSFRIGTRKWTSSDSFNRWILSNEKDTEHYHDVHAKFEGSVNYPKVWKEMEPYKTEYRELRKELNDVRSEPNRDERIANYKEKSRKLKETVLESGRAGMPEFRLANPQLHKQVLTAEFSYVEEDSVYGYNRDGYEADLASFEGQNWAKHTTFKKKYANRDETNRLQDPVDTESTRFYVKIEVLEYDKNKYVTITGRMPDREVFKRFVNIFKDPVRKIVIEAEPLNEVELTETGGFKRPSGGLNKELSESDKRLMEKAREEMYENLIGAPAEKGELQPVSGTAGSGMEEVRTQTIGEPSMHEITQEEFNRLSPEEKDNYNVWADENGFETYF